MKISKLVLFSIVASFSFATVNTSTRVNGSNDFANGKILAVSSNEVENYISKVQNYYFENYFTDEPGWECATLHLGNLEAFKATGNPKYYNDTYKMADGWSWQVNYNIDDTYLDRDALAMVYCALHELAPMDYKLDGVKKMSEFISNRGIFESSWIDEIYMVGYAESYLSMVTNNPKYKDVDFATYMFWRKYFFDQRDGLWYRDANFIYDSDNPNGKSANGKKVYWGRGNAWVYVSLGQRLALIDHSSEEYQTFKNDFILMSYGLKDCVREDGVWSANLGDLDEYSGKEMTGTGGFLYGMCLGMELGILNPDVFLPIVLKAYQTITSKCIYEDGKLGYCQPIGSQPSGYVSEISRVGTTNSFGVGLMLMGLSHFMRLCSDFEEPVLVVEKKEFDPKNAIYTIEPDFYKGPIKATTEFRCETNNGVENVINGIWVKENSYSRMSLYGLGVGPVSFELEFTEPISLRQIVFNVFNNRAYKFVLEAEVNGEYVDIIDTRNTWAKDSLLFKYQVDVDHVRKLRYTAYGYHNGSTDMLSIREMFIYTK